MCISDGCGFENSEFKKSVKAYLEEDRKKETKVREKRGFLLFFVKTLNVILTPFKKNHADVKVGYRSPWWR